MKQKKLGTFQIAIQNVKHSLTRSVGLMFLTAALSFVFFGGAVLTFSLQRGLTGMKDRLGADLMVVPLENDKEMEAILLKGEPGCFYFKKSLEEKIRAVDGVGACSSQFFLTSLDAECCATRVQLIGFDPETDFSVQPWISKVYDKKMEDGAVIIGSEIHVDRGDPLKLFDTEYEVKAQLAPTGTGLDQAVYATNATIKDMYRAAYEKGQRFLEEADPDAYVSSVLVRVKDGADPKEVIRSIRKETGGVQVVEAEGIVRGTAEQMEYVAFFLTLFAALFLLVSVVTFVMTFSLSANSRKREFAILRTIGVTGRKLARILLSEAALIGGIGGAAGTLASALIVLPFHVYIGDRMEMPYLMPGAGALIVTALLTILLSLLICPASSYLVAYRISRGETILTMKEGN